MKRKLLASTLALFMAFSSFAFAPASAMKAPKGIYTSKVILVQKSHKGQASNKNTFTLKNKKITLKAGSSYIVRVAVPSGITISWTSSDNNVATITGGKIVAVSAGTAAITAALSNGNSVTYSVTVKSVTNNNKLRLSKQNETLTVGSSCGISAVIPAGTTVTWASSDANVATLSAGKITAIGAGSCKITATLSDGESAVCNVTVISATDVYKIKLNKSKVSLTVGKSATIKAVATPSTATDKTITWASSNSAVATVAAGKITAVGAGTCTITASTTNGKSAVCNVTVVNAPEVTKVQLRTKLSLKVGKSITLKAIVIPFAAANKTLTWVSSDTGIATVTDGKVTAVSVGTCTVTASTANGKSAICTITVKAAS